MFSVRVQAQDFDCGALQAQLLEAGSDVGAIATFTGIVRSTAGAPVHQLLLEHYPGMTERSIEAIVDEARNRWGLLSVLVVHRVGRLDVGEQIVYVGVAAPHRGAAFDGCEFIMDYLKTRAPFWKKEITAQGEHWVEARTSDAEAAARWEP
ncbi:MAG: molybdopterin synthase catalytic subunit MoaE [Halieaceae bacterium]|jgi:molybdopterin synthase catalytic subunit|nr:molybdopterin synthase catalytic subunit MoaE [Halieaceae bacterium]